MRGTLDVVSKLIHTVVWTGSFAGEIRTDSATSKDKLISLTSVHHFLDPPFPLHPPVRRVLSDNERHHFKSLLLLDARPPQ